MNEDKRLYIIGAGFAGQTIADDIKRKKIFGSVKAFLDDDRNLIGKKIDGIPILGPIAEVASLLRFKKQDEAIIAIPSAPVEKTRKIYEVLKDAGVAKIKILPGISQVVNGSAHLVQTRDIDPLDILGRTPVTISLKESLSYLRGKRVMITGAGGSIGSELSRQLLSGGAERLYLFGHGENSIYQIDRELRLLQEEGVGEKATIVPIIGDMTDRAYTDYIIEQTKSYDGRKSCGCNRKQRVRHKKHFGFIDKARGHAICPYFHGQGCKSGKRIWCVKNNMRKTGS